MAVHELCGEADLGVGEKKAFKINGEDILLFRLDDGYYATQAKCTHLFMPLEKGDVVDGCRVQCKFHRAEFDIKTGEVSNWACFPPGIQALNFIRGEKDLKTYPTSVEGGKVFVEA